jgi:hypothetical protein
VQGVGVEAQEASLLDDDVLNIGIGFTALFSLSRPF